MQRHLQVKNDELHGETIILESYIKGKKNNRFHHLIPPVQSLQKKKDFQIQLIIH